MRALITGGAGFAGRHLAAELRSAGWQVTTLDRRPPADILLDLASDPLPRLSFDVVFHLAGWAAPAASSRTPEDTYVANVEATGRLIHALRRGRLILASSGHVYGPVPEREGPADETRAPLPQTPYAASKLCAEALALAAWRDTVVLRPFNHTGPGQSDKFVCPRIARQVARAEAGRGPRRIAVEDLAPRIDLFDVRDMARAYRLAAERGRAGEIYNVATGRTWSIRTLVEIFRSLARVPLGIRGSCRDPRRCAGNASKFRRHTGWTPQIPLKRTLEDLLNHERSRLGRPTS